MLERSEPIFDGEFVLVTYTGQPGDVLPVHDHLYNHTTRVVEGEIEAFDNAGKTSRRTVAHKPLEFTAGVRHGVRCITRAVFENRSPSPGFLAEQQGA